MRGSERERESVRERRTTYQSIDIGHTPHDGGAKHVVRRRRRLGAIVVYLEGKRGKRGREGDAEIATRRTWE